jgi:hypothetical protein
MISPIQKAEGFSASGTRPQQPRRFGGGAKQLGETVMGDAKKIAVIVRDRQGEALRMAVGLTLADDEVSVFIMDKKIEPDDAMELNIETLKDMGGSIYTNNPDNPFEQMSTEEIASTLVKYDSIVPY